MFKKRILLLCMLCLFFSAVAVTTRSFSSPGIAVEERSNAVVSQIQEDVVQSEYHVVPINSAVYQAPNRQNGMRTTFSADGVDIGPRLDGAASWSLSMSVAQVGDETGMVDVDEATLHSVGNQIRMVRGNMVEWYVNGVRGLEQGFTFSAPPLGTASDMLYVDVALEGTLNGRMANPDAVEFVTETGAVVLEYSHLYAFDVNARPLHATLQVQRNDDSQILRIAVNTVNADYPIVIDPLFSTPDWIGQTNQDDQYGFAVSSAGDVNGDGFDDVIVGAKFYDSGAANRGAAFVYLGSADGIIPTVHWQALGTAANAEFGYSVDGAGDTNNDGYDDVIVGSPGNARARVYYGSSTGLGTRFTVLTGQNNSQYGISVSTAGDVNGDNFDDVVVGSPDYVDGAGDDHGRAYVYYGASSGVNATAAWIAEQRKINSDFGMVVTGGGDVTGDGTDDILISDTYANTTEEDVGTVYLYHGVEGEGLQSGPIASEQDAFAFLDDPFFQDSGFGHSMAFVDIDGDNVQDVLVGAPLAPLESGEVFGDVYLYFGPITQPVSPNFFYSGSQDGEQFGYAVSSAGDINNDGYEEFMIGAPNYIQGDPASNRSAGSAPPEGAVYLFEGSPDAASTGPNPLTFEVGNKPGAYLGTSVSSAGDTNDDGHDDILMGAPGYDDGSPGSGAAVALMGTGPIASLTAVNDGPTELGDPTLLSTMIDVPDSGFNYYTWDFGDGSFGEGKNVSHTYSAAGSYTAMVTVSNLYGSIAATTTVKVTNNVLIDPVNGGSQTFNDGQGNSTEINVPGGAVDDPIIVEYTPLTLGTVNREAKGNTVSGIEQPLPLNYTNYFFDLDAAETLKVFLPLIYHQYTSSTALMGGVAAVPQAARGRSCPTGHYCFNTPVTIVIQYSEGSLNGQNENELSVVWWDEATMSWLDATETCEDPSGYIIDTADNTVTFKICQISRFGMVGAN